MGLALHFQMPMRERGRLQRSAAALAFGVVLAVAGPMATVARAQSYTWGGSGSTTTTPDYGTATNWSTPLFGAPPIFPSQSAVFGTSGSSTVTIGGGPMLPDSWTFTANAQSYTISGNPVSFSLSGSSGGSEQFRSI